MTDVYTEDSDEYGSRPGALDQLRADVARTRHRLERRIQSSASDAMDETRMLVRRAQHRINSQLGVFALIALCAGVTLGLLAAAVFRGRAPHARE